MLRVVEPEGHSAAMRLGVPPPDLGLDVVREQHRWARERGRQVDGRRKKVADHEMKRLLFEESLRSSL